MKATVKDLEIRGKEVKTSKKTELDYIIVRVEDDTGKSYEFIDRDMNNLEYYHKGKTADFILDMEVYGRNWAINVDSFKLKD